MAMKDEYVDSLAGLWFIRRTARRLARLPDWRLRLTMEEAVEAEYVNECLAIALRICGCRAVSMPPLNQEENVVLLYHWCMGKAARQAGRLLWGIRLGRIGKYRFNHDAWCNIDSAEVHMRELASCEIKRKGRYLWFFRRKRL